MNLSRISSWSIRNPIPVVVLFIVLTLGGVIGFPQLRVNAAPDIDYPIVAVTIAQSGASPSELESQVTRLVENSVAGLGGVHHIYSTVNEGASTTTVEFNIGVDVERATNDVRNAVASIRANMPQDVLDPIVQRLDVTGSGTLINYVVNSPTMDEEQLSWFVEDTIAKKVMSVKGVASVTRTGGVNREIRIKLDPGRLASFGITAGQVSQQLKLTNANLPGGRGEIGRSEQAMRTLGSAETVDDLRQMRVNLPNGRAVRLQDLGEVVDQWAEPRGIARLNNKSVVGFAVERTKGTGEVDVASRARVAVAEIQKQHPEVKIQEVASSDAYTKRGYDASAEALGLGALLAVIVVWLFLRDWRATLIAAIAMPLSLIPTFWLMQLFNISLNGVSMLALALTIGILVDDAIVEIENIVRHMREGKKPYPAAIEAADEIGLAVVATTAVLIAVFAPTGVMGGIVGEYFRSFAFAAVVSVAFSLVVARTLTPLMGAYILRRDTKREHKDEPFWMPFYQRRLRWSLRHRWIVLWAGFVFFVASLVVAVVWVPKDLFPNQDVGRTTASIELPPGATLAETDAVTQKMTAILLKRPEVVNTYAIIGSGTTTLGGVNSTAGEVRTARITAILKDRHQRKLTQNQFEAEVTPLLQQVSGARVSFARAGGGGAQASITLVSDDPVALRKAATAVEQEMRQVPGLADVASSAAMLRPEIIIRPKRDIAAQLGVSAADISQVARIATLGDADQLLPKFNLADRQIPIRVMLDENARESLGVISTLQVPTRSGATVPLSTVADVTFGAGPNQIDRIDRLQTADVSARLVGITLGDGQQRIHALHAMKNLPAGVSEKSDAGDLQILIEVFTGFAFAIGSGILLMYLVLVLLFRSFATPATILAALPVSYGGAFILLLLTNSAISLPSLIGLIMLTGVAAKNSILLVEYAIEARRAGMSREEALLDAAHKRARPIIMTTVAMGAGMLPIALKLGAGGEFRQPMAIAVIGGLVTSTLLSLVFVPAYFTVVDDVRTFVKRVFARALEPEGKAEDAEDAGLRRPAE
jgi:HAE1 family hydrophobic/amphiphilic exporter-1